MKPIALVVGMSVAADTSLKYVPQYILSSIGLLFKGKFTRLTGLFLLNLGLRQASGLSAPVARAGGGPDQGCQSWLLF